MSKGVCGAMSALTVVGMLGVSLLASWSSSWQVSFPMGKGGRYHARLLRLSQPLPGGSWRHRSVTRVLWNRQRRDLIRCLLDSLVTIYGRSPSAFGPVDASRASPYCRWDGVFSEDPLRRTFSPGFGLAFDGRGLSHGTGNPV
ncbi:MAG: hypothetical protein P1U82_00530 [Verrucomicrobiales bacterium]|nr:hypothetical protein [Verrucomicrobiales bacterium]